MDKVTTLLKESLQVGLGQAWDFEVKHVLSLLGTRTHPQYYKIKNGNIGDLICFKGSSPDWIQCSQSAVEPRKQYTAPYNGGQREVGLD